MNRPGRPQRTAFASRHISGRKLAFECLETRRMLASDPVLLKDVNSNTPTSNPEEFPLIDIARDVVESGENFYFTAGGSGQELWKTDGTTEGTVVLGQEIRRPRVHTDINDTLYFLADDNDGLYDIALWKSDGTEAGTVLIHGSLLDGPGSLAESGGQVFFATYNNPLNELVFSELYKTDGTVNGTVFIQDFIDTTQNVTLD